MYHESDSSKIRLLSQDFQDDGRDPDGENSVAATLAISFEQIRRNDRQAAELLSLMSVLDRQNIPRSLLLSDIEEVELERALGTLKAFSLITSEQSGQSFTFDHLIYLATRNWMRMNEELDSWTEKALVLLSERFPNPEFENQDLWMAYLPHAHTVLESNHLPASKITAQATLLFNVSRAVTHLGVYDLAETMARKSFDLRKKALGGKNLETMYSVSNLGSELLRNGKNKEAEELNRQALRGFEEMLGEEHPDTLDSTNNLADVLADQGKFEEAEKLYRQTLIAKDKILGNEHPDMQTGINKLAHCLQQQGQVDEAATLHKRMLIDNEITPGRAVPDPLGNFPGPLTRIIMSIPRDRIWFSAEDDLSVWNKVKTFVENHTEENWNWWPLRPRMRMLQINQTRLHWRCVSNLPNHTYKKHV